MVLDEITWRVSVFREMKVAQRQSPEHQVTERKRTQPRKRTQEDVGRKQNQPSLLEAAGKCSRLRREIYRPSAARSCEMRSSENAKGTDPRHRSTGAEKYLEVGRRDSAGNGA